MDGTESLKTSEETEVAKISANLPVSDLGYLRGRAQRSRTNMTSELHKAIAISKRLEGAISEGSRVVILSEDGTKVTDVGLWLE
ncbi:MAG: hypothetical protein H0U10_16105 [Chloroflexia bacterium]|nr:hypothetical protein [Chloroflexia bacterium]